MADSLDPSIVVSSWEEWPLPVALCKPDGTLIVSSRVFRAVTGLANGGRAEWFSVGGIPDLKLNEKHFQVWTVPCGDGLWLGLAEMTEVVHLEETLSDFQLRLSKVYSELNIKNKNISDALEEVRRRERELAQLNETLERKVEEQVAQLERTGRLKRYLSPDIANSIISENALNLNPHKRLITIFLAELADFDDLTSEVESEEVVEILNEYHREMTALIFAHGGTIDKFIVSRIIGFFGDPIPMSDHAQKAVRAVLAMREKVRELRGHWFLTATHMELRAGVHTGYATVGNVGSSERMDYTVIGKNVTLTSQLQQEARPGQILLSRRTYELIKDDFDCEHQEMAVRTGSKPISVYNLTASKGAGIAPTVLREETAPQSQPASSGQHLGPYRLLEKLGEGGMGIVYKGWDESLERNVALKLLSPGLSRDEKFLSRFKKEAKALATLNSPHIAQIYFIGSDREQSPFFAMEFVEGSTVAARIKREGCLPLRQTLEIVAQVVQALEAALEKGIVHRDIKPDNIMLTRENLVKVTDFGLAKSSVDDSSKTADGLILGTPYYMSPEQAKGQEVDYRSDMYSVGATMYHMLVGQPPFRGDSAIEILRKHEEMPLPALATLPADITTRIYNIILRLLAKNRVDRFPTYQALREELGNC